MVDKLLQHPRFRLFAFWGALTVFAGGCAVRGASAFEQTKNALLITGVSALFLGTIVWMTRWAARRSWSSSERGSAIGFIFGLVLAAVIIRRVPLETQLVAIGVVLGLGTDFLSALKDPEGPRTAIDRVANFIASTASAVQNAADTTGFHRKRERVIAAGIWAFLGTILFTLVIGNLF